MDINQKTLEDLKASVAIAAAESDYESAHGSEDELRECALKLILAICERNDSYETVKLFEIEEAAKVALSTDDMEFDRWYA